jgi:type II secretory pathway predicted ATPase ExeA
VYYEYWGLTKPPFDNVPDPSMYVDSHSSVENAVAETLFAIEEGNECIAVIVGDVGSGKTLSLRLILDGLQPDKYCFAFITNPDISFGELLREIVTQLMNNRFVPKRKLELLEAFNRILFETADQGKKVVLFIDEANVMSGPNLESLRLLTNMQDDDRNLFTLVLAGQLELAVKLQHPKRANLYQRIGTYNRIHKIESFDHLRKYVATRMRLAGGKQMPFTDAAIVALWECSERGVPRLVNRICKLCLKAGETNGFRAINDGVVNQIGGRFARSRLVNMNKRTVSDKAKSNETRGQPRVDSPSKNAPSKMSSIREPESGPKNDNCAITDQKPSSVVDIKERSLVAKDLNWETDIGNHRIQIAVPRMVVEQIWSATPEAMAKIAGAIAAQTLQRYPQLAFSPSHDPVTLWSDIRKSILMVIDCERTEAKTQ